MALSVPSRLVGYHKEDQGQVAYQGDIYTECPS